jgi:DNA-binding response OmpR family regulator
MYKRVLSYNRFKVETAGNAEFGFIKAKSFKHNIILLNVIMPKMNGLQLLKIKKSKQTQDIAVILLTNLGLQEEQDKALNNGVSRYT